MEIVLMIKNFEFSLQKMFIEVKQTYSSFLFQKSIVLSLEGKLIQFREKKMTSFAASILKFFSIKQLFLHA